MHIRQRRIAMFFLTKRHSLRGIEWLVVMSALIAACHTTAPPSDPDSTANFKQNEKDSFRTANSRVNENPILTTIPPIVDKAVWARDAVPLRQASVDKKEISSPDGNVRISVGLQVGGDSDRNLSLHVKLPAVIQDINLDEGANELLWSGDSRAFLVNGGYNAYSGFFVTVYVIGKTRIDRFDITAQAQRDMVESFPPCKAANRDERDCRKLEQHPEFNMSGLGWINGSAGVVVFAEIPPSSFYGGILGQVLGYELEIPSGKILRRLSAAEFKKQWQPIAAWNISVPEPPEYGSPYDPKER
jgi:hypothetical protein